MLIAPSILSADFGDLLNDIHKTEEGGADYIHVDVMDGHFVPNISFGAPVMKSLVGRVSIPFDVHLMITDPAKYAKDFVTDNTEFITFHREAVEDPEEVIDLIHSYGVKAGISIKPGTPTSALEGFFDKVDLILIMSVNPGFGGQKMIPSALHKIEELKRRREELGLDFRIEIDGGVNLDNIAGVAQAGTDIIVAGSAAFGAEDIAGRVRDLIRRAQVNG